MTSMLMIFLAARMALKLGTVADQISCNAMFPNFAILLFCFSGIQHTQQATKHMMSKSGQ